jgi:hypothetical protein
LERECTICKKCIIAFELNLKIDTKQYTKCSFCGYIDKCAETVLTDEERITIVVDEENPHEYVWW